MPDARVLVVEDHPLFRKGVVALLDAVADLAVVGTAASGEEAVERVSELAPDVVLMDLQLPGMSGIETTRAIVAAHPGVAVLVLTMFEDDGSVFSAMRAGARGYLLKGADHTEIVRAVAAVAGGEAIFGAAVAERILEFFAAPRPRTPEAVFPQLTAREHEVLELIAAGRSNAELAATLVLSPKTVRNHVSNIFAKLQVADRAQAIVLAREAGLGR
jgi:DNA-binding NarL/FixJ family response regulator